MATPTFRNIASGLVTRLDTQMAYLNTCRLYAGEIEDLGAGQPFDQAPACFVVFEGLEPAGDTYTERVFRARYSVVCVAKVVGGGAAKMESGTYSAHKLVEDVLTYGVDNAFSLTGFEGLNPGAVRRVKISPTAAVYVVELIGLIELAA